MRELTINASDAGQRFDKYLFKFFKEAPSSFVYKMLRKKNIVLNGKKSDGRDILSSGDIIKIFMADDTIDKFTGFDKKASLLGEDDLYTKMPEVIYEDGDIMLINKPAGMLSQKSSDDTISLNEIALSYLIHNKKISEDSIRTYKPSICNRLDRNTSGIMIFAKTYAGANEMSALLRDRSMHKYYLCIVKGRVDKEMTIEGFLTKDEASNRVTIVNDKASNIYTKIKPVSVCDKLSLLEILLITGKTHQIRAHLASIGHPIIGDYKYGDNKLNEYYKDKYNIDSQLLCAYKVEFPNELSRLRSLSNKTFTIKTPNTFKRVLSDGDMEI